MSVSDTATTDVLIVGGGIAGLSLAASLAPTISVRVLEREEQPGYHATGRSAAYYSPALGDATVQSLTLGSRSFFQDPPADFTSAPLLHRRDALHLFPAAPLATHADGSAESLELLGRDQTADVSELSVAEAEALWPVLRPGYLKGAALERGGGDLDVDALLQGYRRQLLAHDGDVVLNAALRVATWSGSSWKVETDDQAYRAAVIVNAAGAWADELAILANVPPIGLEPLRRTAMVLPLAPTLDASGWPFVVQGGPDTSFYVRPDAGHLMLSAADEHLSAPCDAQAEEWDVALAVDRLQRASTLRFERVVRTWAGLRTFAPDRAFVVGFDPGCAGFFWCAGQGGYGVQTAPALSRLAAKLLLNALRPTLVGTQSLADEEGLVAAISPCRFSGTTASRSEVLV